MVNTEIKLCLKKRKKKQNRIPTHQQASSLLKPSMQCSLTTAKLDLGGIGWIALRCDSSPARVIENSILFSLENYMINLERLPVRETPGSEPLIFGWNGVSYQDCEASQNSLSIEFTPHTQKKKKKVDLTILWYPFLPGVWQQHDCSSYWAVWFSREQKTMLHGPLPCSVNHWFEPIRCFFSPQYNSMGLWACYPTIMKSNMMSVF